SAISNAFPGLECDFRNVWRNIFVGITLHESDSRVVSAEDTHRDLIGRRLVFVESEPIVLRVFGPKTPGGAIERLPNFASIEWSNALATFVHLGGTDVTAYFTCV